MPHHKIPINGFGRLMLPQNEILSLVDCLKVREKAEVPDLPLPIPEEVRELPKVFILKSQYEKLDPDVIFKMQEEAHCVLAPVEQEVFDRIQQEVVVINAQPPMPEIQEVPEIIFEDAPHISLYDSGKHGGNKTPRIPPKDYAKKKKAKRRQQKSSRKKH